MSYLQLSVKNEILAFRAVIFCFIAFYLLYAPALQNGGSAAPLLLALTHLGSIVAMGFLKPRRFETSLVQGAVFLGDILLVTCAIYLSGAWSGDLYIVYFAVILMAGTQAEARHSFLVGGVGAVLYGWLWAKSGEAETVTPSVGLRFAFFFVVAFFSAYFAHQSARRREEAARARRLQEKMERFAAVGRFAKGMAREFDRLVRTIMGSVHILGDLMPADDRKQVPLQAVRGAGERAAQLTRKLLQFCRQQEVKPAAMQAHDLLRELEPALADELGSAVRLSLRLDALRDGIAADRGQLSEILFEFAANAREAMPAGGVFRISTDNAGAAADGASRWLVVQLADSGRGMEDGELERVFEPFFTTKADGQGAGLSLAGAHGVVGKAGGRITVESFPGGGTVFRLFLPLAD